MARQKKYPEFPRPEEKEVPYDTEHFIMWCVDEEGMSEQSAYIYVSRIRTAFEIVFNGNYSIFELLAQAFRGYLRQPEICLKNLEMVSAHLKHLIELMSQLPPTEFFESHGLNYTSKNLSEWVSAFFAYHRYYEWRIDKLRVELGHPTEIVATKKELMLPLKKDFSEYLRKECHYAPASVWAHMTFLMKLKNLFFCFLFDEDVFDVITEDDEDWESTSAMLTDMIELVDIEIAMVKGDHPDKSSIALSVADLKRGQQALRKYYDFLKYRFKQKHA